MSTTNKKPTWSGHQVGFKRICEKQLHFTLIAPIGATDSEACPAHSTRLSGHFAPHAGSVVNHLVSVTTMAAGDGSHHGIGVPVPKAQQPRPTTSSGFFTPPSCAGHGFAYGGPCGASQDAPVPLAGTPTHTVCHPRLASRAAGFEPVPKEPIMADTRTPQQSAGNVALRAYDLTIHITPRAYTEYYGTAAQLIAEGLIPDGFKWPDGVRHVTIEVGDFCHWIGRRPDGHKGPMSSWTSGDYWSLRRSLISQSRDSGRTAELYAKKQELADIIYRGTPEYSRIANASWKAHCDDKYQAFRELVIPKKKSRRVAGGAA